jgi:hypothetical protein
MISVDTATSIINEAKSGGYEDQPMPEADQEILARAEWWVEEAAKAYEKGMKTDTIKTILTLGLRLPVEEGGEEKPAAEAEEQPVEIAKSEDLPSHAEEAKEPEVYDAPGVPGDPPSQPIGSPSEAVKAAEKVEVDGKVVKALDKERLPIPAEIEGDPIEMPFDLTGEDDRSIRRLHGVYAAYAARVDYLVATESQALHHAKIVFQHEYDRARKQVPKIDANEKSRLSADIEADVNDDEGVKAWADKVNQHESALLELKALALIYTRNIGVLSREWSMRSDEWQATSGGGG